MPERWPPSSSQGVASSGLCIKGATDQILRIGKYDAAVIDRENDKPHIVKRVDHPRISVLPEVLGRGALPSGELRDAAKDLDPGEAALIVVGEPTLAKGFDKAVTRANKVAKESFDTSADTLADELIKAAKR